MRRMSLSRARRNTGTGRQASTQVPGVTSDLIQSLANMSTSQQQQPEQQQPPPEQQQEEEVSMSLPQQQRTQRPMTRSRSRSRSGQRPSPVPQGPPTGNVGNLGASVLREMQDHPMGVGSNMEALAQQSLTGTPRDRRAVRRELSGNNANSLGIIRRQDPSPHRSMASSPVAFFPMDGSRPRRRNRDMERLRAASELKDVKIADLAASMESLRVAADAAHQRVRDCMGNVKAHSGLIEQLEQRQQRLNDSLVRSQQQLRQQQQQGPEQGGALDERTLLRDCAKIKDELELVNRGISSNQRLLERYYEDLNEARCEFYQCVARHREDLDSINPHSRKKMTLDVLRATNYTELLLEIFPDLEHVPPPSPSAPSKGYFSTDAFSLQRPPPALRPAMGLVPRSGVVKGDGIDIYDDRETVPRQELISNLAAYVMTGPHNVIHIESPRHGGKTTNAQLLERILKANTDANVIAFKIRPEGDAMVVRDSYLDECIAQSIVGVQGFDDLKDCCARQGNKVTVLIIDDWHNLASNDEMARLITNLPDNLRIVTTGSPGVVSRLKDQGYNFTSAVSRDLERGGRVLRSTLGGFSIDETLELIQKKHSDLTHLGADLATFLVDETAGNQGLIAALLDELSNYQAELTQQGRDWPSLADIRAEMATENFLLTLQRNNPALFHFNELSVEERFKLFEVAATRPAGPDYVPQRLTTNSYSLAFEPIRNRYGTIMGRRRVRAVGSRDNRVVTFDSAVPTSDPQIQSLIQKGLLTTANLNGGNNNSLTGPGVAATFSSPLMRKMHDIQSLPIPRSSDDFIIAGISRMSGSKLINSSRGSNDLLLEQSFEDEFKAGVEKARFDDADVQISPQKPTKTFEVAPAINSTLKKGKIDIHATLRASAARRGPAALEVGTPLFYGLVEVLRNRDLPDNHYDRFEPFDPMDERHALTYKGKGEKEAPSKYNADLYMDGQAASIALLDFHETNTGADPRFVTAHITGDGRYALVTFPTREAVLARQPPFNVPTFWTGKRIVIELKP